MEIKKINIVNFNEVIKLKGIDQQDFMNDVKGTLEKNGSSYKGQIGDFTGKMHEAKYLNEVLGNNGVNFIYLSNPIQEGYDVLVGKKEGYRPIPL